MSQTFADNLLPSASGYDLGSSPSQEWDVFAQTLAVSGAATFSGAVTISGALGGLTTISLSGQLTSTLVTGTAPFVVASTTVNTNLNADLLDGNDWTAPGTIGGTTPGAASFTTISATGQFTSTLGTGTAPLVVASTTQVSNLNVSQLIGATWVSPGNIGSTTPATGAFTTLTTTPVASSTITVGGSLDADYTAATVNANSTSAQNMMSYSAPAAILNTAGKTLRIWMSGLYTTQGGQTPTITVDVQFGGVTIASFLSTATTASQTDAPWEAVIYATTASTGGTGTLETHGFMNIRLGGAAGAASCFQDTSTAASSAIDLTAANTLQCRVTFSTNTSPANSVTQRQLIVELLN